MLSCQALNQLSHLPSLVFYFFCLPAYGTLMKRLKTVSALSGLSFLTVEGSGEPCSPAVLPPHSCILRRGSEFCIVPTQHTYCHPGAFNFSSFCLVPEKKGRCSWCQGEPRKIPPRQGGRGSEEGGQERGIFF